MANVQHPPAAHFDVDTAWEGAATPPAAGRARRLVWLGCSALVLLTLIAFRPAFDNGFVAFDDPQYVTDAPYSKTGLSWQGVRLALLEPRAGNWHPLTILSHMADIELFGLNPRGHHLVSVLIHLANVWLLFLCLHALTGEPLPSAIVAALFAVHPLRAESVAWVSERKDVLCGLFWVLAMVAYLRWTRGRSARQYGLLLLSFALALLSKPMAVTLPLALLLLDFWPLDRLGDLRMLHLRGASHRLAQLVVEKVPLFSLAAAIVAVALWTQAPTIEHASHTSWTGRLANALVAYASYILDTFVPRGLAFFYPYPDTIPAWKVASSAILLLAISTLAVISWRRAPAVLMGWLWYLLVLLPVIGLLKVGEQARADRYTYLPSIGLLVAVVWGARAWAPRSTQRVLTAVALLAIVGLVPLTRAQVSVWRDSETLFRHAIAHTENNYVAQLNLAETLRRENRSSEALEHYLAAVEASPERAETLAALGQALGGWGRPAEALPYLRRALELAPHDVRVLVNLASACTATGRTDEAVAYLEQALEVDPRQLPAHWGLAAIAAQHGDLETALLHYRIAAQLAPDDPRFQQAVEDLESRLATPDAAEESLSDAGAPRP